MDNEIPLQGNKRRDRRTTEKSSDPRMPESRDDDSEKRYWGQHLWGRGYFCATVGSVTEEMIKEYIEKHAESSSQITVQGEF